MGCINVCEMKNKRKRDQKQKEGMNKEARAYEKSSRLSGAFSRAVECRTKGVNSRPLMNSIKASLLWARRW